jgi:hypothetical protein
MPNVRIRVGFSINLRHIRALLVIHSSSTVTLDNSPVRRIKCTGPSRPFITADRRATSSEKFHIPRWQKASTRHIVISGNHTDAEPDIAHIKAVHTVMFPDIPLRSGWICLLGEQQSQEDHLQPN